MLGRALTYRRSYRVSDDGGRTWYPEAWQPGSLAQSIEACRNQFELRALHRDVRVGLVTFEDGPSDLRFRATIDGSEDGDALLEDAQAAGMPGVSLGFRPRGERRDAATGVLWRLRALVRELSVTDRAQYPDAQVLTVRADADPALAVPTAAQMARLKALEAVLRRGDALVAYSPHSGAGAP
jgi:phage head maturation protease